MGSAASSRPARKSSRKYSEIVQVTVSPTNLDRKTAAAGAVSTGRGIFVGCNWKCGLETSAQVDLFVRQLNEAWRHNTSILRETELCVFPPFVYLDKVRSALDPGMHVGSQNSEDALPDHAASGEVRKLTGTVTARMLQSIGCKWVLLGHSDRRNVIGESDVLIAEKVVRCLEMGLHVNLTVGESLQARQAGIAIPTLLRQFGLAAAHVQQSWWDRIVVAYEPVWAIGKDAVACSPREAQLVLAALRGWLRDHVNASAAETCRFVYTGSISEYNVHEYTHLPDLDGFVVGRAGNDVTALMSVCTALALAKNEGPRGSTMSAGMELYS